MKKPLVSICCITYNHESYIKNALDGFVMQKTNFPFEIVISDDCSKDETRKVIEEYKIKYPNLIRDVSPQKNLGVSKNFSYVQQCAHGKYIAICEGDDYWTDQYKLQKQVDFMEKHPDYSVCWHRCTYFSINSSIIVEDNCDKILKDKEGVDITLEDFFNGWYTQPLTTLLRRSAYDSQWYKQYQYYRDEHEFYHLLKRGKGYLFAFVGGVYVKHNGGIYTSMSENSRREVGLKVARELYNVNKDAYTYHFYCQTLQWLINENAHSFKKKLEYSWELFKVNTKFGKFLKNVILQ